jgi:hypothetical protein
MTPDYRNIHARTCDKLLRQRAHWLKLARIWEKEAGYAYDDVTRRELQTKVECIMRCAADLKYIAAKAMEELPVDDLDQIARMKDDPNSKVNQLFAA